MMRVTILRRVKRALLLILPAALAVIGRVLEAAGRAGQGQGLTAGGAEAAARAVLAFSQSAESTPASPKRLDRSTTGAPPPFPKAIGPWAVGAVNALTSCYDDAPKGYRPNTEDL